MIALPSTVSMWAHYQNQKDKQINKQIFYKCSAFLGVLPSLGVQGKSVRAVGGPRDQPSAEAGWLPVKTNHCVVINKSVMGLGRWLSR